MRRLSVTGVGYKSPADSDGQNTCQVAQCRTMAKHMKPSNKIVLSRYKHMPRTDYYASHHPAAGRHRKTIGPIICGTTARATTGICALSHSETDNHLQHLCSHTRFTCRHVYDICQGHTGYVVCQSSSISVTWSCGDRCALSHGRPNSFVSCRFKTAARPLLV